MQERATGLVLRTRPLTESSLIVQWLTRDHGRLSTVAKGARRTKSPFSGKLDLFYAGNFTFQPRRRSELHTLLEITVFERHLELRREAVSFQQACYFVQLVEQVTETNTPLPGLFQLIMEALELAVRRPPQSILVLAFEIKLLVDLGLNPESNGSHLTPTARAALDHLARADWTTIEEFQWRPADITELDRFLNRYLLHHFGRVGRARTQALSSAFLPSTARL